MAGFSFSAYSKAQGVIISDQQTPEALRYEGVVRWFSPEKGYGFIKVENQHDVKGVREFFCHFTGIRGDGFRNLKENQVVNFEIVMGPKGKQANDTFVVSEPEPAAPAATEEEAE